MSETRTKIPMNARSEKAICALSHDNVCQGDFSIMIGEGVVWLSEQAMGEPQKQHIEIPRKAFDAFVTWYTTGKVPRGDKASRTPPYAEPTR